MKQSIKTILMTVLLGVGLALPVFISEAAHAVNPISDACSQSGSASSICTDPNANTVGSVTKTIVNVLLFVVGIVSVIMIIIGGIRFATSGSDSGAVSSAKNTILYAVVGLVIAFIAFAVVNWVLRIL